MDYVGETSIYISYLLCLTNKIPAMRPTMSKIPTTKTTTAMIIVAVFEAFPSTELSED